MEQQERCNEWTHKHFQICTVNDRQHHAAKNFNDQKEKLKSTQNSRFLLFLNVIDNFIMAEKNQKIS